jgi:3-oxoadipate enol-lactonase
MESQRSVTLEFETTMSFQSGTAFDLYFELTGPEDGPVLVFCHALGGDMSLWDAPVAKLAGRYRILRYDMRGHGRSGQPAGPLTLGDLAQDVFDLLKYHSMGRIHFCGLSLGGMVGQWIGLNAPERLESLVLVDTAPEMGSPETWDARIAEIQRNGMAAIAGSTMERWFTREFREREPQTVAHFEAILQATAPAGYIANAQVVRKGVLSISEFERFRSIDVQTLIVTGTHDAAATPAEAQLLASYIPRSRYVELAAAHISPVEASEEFTNSLAAFLSSGAG